MINVWQNGTFDLVLDEVLGPLLTLLNLILAFMGFRIILVFGGLKVLIFTVLEGFKGSLIPPQVDGEVSMVWSSTASRTPKVVILMVLGGILVSFLLIPIEVLLR